MSIMFEVFKMLKFVKAGWQVNVFISLCFLITFEIFHNLTKEGIFI